ncbi:MULTISPECIES: DUF441 domain-containing protein [Moraxella]|uniref:UPF0756 membrane protein A9309_00500 n=1 Tax=Moraxella lacunata TaxID=477 RepID=A0A1B8PYK7_MORLA|nr:MULTISPECIES: DUF441 domain-containing protein [Moraxella]MBE9579766.1 DUF441 domain-containing protein [Moraxella sp. K1664]MBE9588889.1 DUF441 domain-containing protein [Moraxella sp. K1630]MBE9591765.1 DUF441 domain-containing protein [Moraxella sp. K127]MBE9597119.1 DUF441 domain-containing protein [Moraxella sp. K2450]MDH9219654.1 DUF441 domain-containing protein [Moraxella lacunata]
MPNFTHLLSTLDVSLIILFILLGLGVFSQNNTIIIATALLIVVKVSPLNAQLMPVVEKYGLSLGILILTIGVLAPIASGKISGEVILKSFVSVKSLLAIAVGVLVAYLGGRGVKLMTDEPSVIAGLLIGTVAGVALLRGVPVGPLIAAGILSLFYWK